MKKALFLMLVFPSLLFAQVDSLKSKVKKNEITINAFELIVVGVLPINYERFIYNNLSITIKTFFFDQQYLAYNTGDTNLISLQTQCNFYLSKKKQNAGFFLAPFLKFTGGRYLITAIPPITKLDVNVSSTGFELGYKFLFKNKLSFSINTDIGRVLSRYAYNSGSEIDTRLGANLGIRF